MKKKLEKPMTMFEKRRLMAEKMMEDMIKNMREMQKEFEKKISEYAENIPEKLSMDVMETDDAIIIKTDLPGVKKEDINIELTENTISISAVFEEEVEIEEADFIKKERKYGEAKREMRLPEKIRVEDAKAKFENGVLTVELPKVEVKKKQTLKVE
ncbi:MULTISPECIES: Hsp20/alpha crystallin family protein [Methanothermobacter]|uniref:Heat shock protein Hsp20 n=1 Tax=Methanothermobacter defluvii TaxID=49339 RepID=A0A371NDB9_9EURY|nr:MULTISPECIES: Hsp20/alpha crystallin family protein [Methanothermobacter]MDI6818800.1 Hsp20/alpha crystallin family protein [Methanothermobacter thermautotrophicus]REE28511.1 heat shock protein Hsp20 [Methanothermobacter defluvii]BAZ98894.1 Spore protein SP21 [Methanothermobacter sp. EMTCatA1]